MVNPLSALESLKKLAGKVGAAGKDLKARRERILQRLDELHHLPPTREDVLESLYMVVDQGEEDFRNRLAVQLKSSLQNAELGTITGKFPLLCPNSGRAWYDLLGVSIYGLFAPQVKESLARIIADMEWPEAGPSIAERRNEIEKLHKELTLIERELSELEQAAESAGVTIQ